MLLKVFQWLFLLLFYSPIFIAAWLITDRMHMLLQAESVSAQITHCEKRSRVSGGRTIGGWVPIATFAGSETAEGSFSVKSQAWCEWQLDDHATVLVGKDTKQPVVIFNFWQFWFFPLLMTMLAGGLLFLFIRNWHKKRRQQPTR